MMAQSQAGMTEIENEILATATPTPTPTPDQPSTTKKR
jgi:hypothetical protein